MHALDNKPLWMQALILTVGGVVVLGYFAWLLLPGIFFVVPCLIKAIGLIGGVIIFFGWLIWFIVWFSVGCTLAENAVDYLDDI